MAAVLRRSHVVQAEIGPRQAAKELNEDTWTAAAASSATATPDTMASAAFALILSGLAADPKAREAMETITAAWAQSVEGRQPDG